MTDPDKLRVLELYSGIGGMHFALQESTVPYEVIAAIDINTTANKIYKHNFKETYLMDSGIETLTVTQLDRMKIDMILMSPPCQPFTRVGKKLDNEDARTKSFLHLLDILPQLTYCPSYILVENVKGFEESQTRGLLVKTLEKCKFQMQEYLLSPLQFSIPNSRLRYYMIAKRQPSEKSVSPPEISNFQRKKRKKSIQEKHILYTFYMKVAEKSKVVYSLLPTTNGRLKTPEIICEVPMLVQPYLKYRFLSAKEGKCNHGDNSTSLILGTDELSNHTSSNETSCIEQNNVESTGTCDINKEETDDACNEISQSKSESTCTNYQNATELQGCENKSTNTKKLKTKHHDETENNVKHSNDEDNCRLCDNDEELLKEGQLMRQDGDSTEDDCKCLQLNNFLEKKTTDYFNKFKVPDKDLKRFIVMDIVIPCVKKTICFTKRYGHYMEGAGSIIQMCTDVETVQNAKELKLEAIEKKNNKSWGEKEIDIIRKLQLRYFTPREISNLLCFPQSFSFPDDISTIQKYRVLGNSLNVHVVSVLIHLLLSWQ